MKPIGFTLFFAFLTLTAFGGNSGPVERHLGHGSRHPRKIEKQPNWIKQNFTMSGGAALMSNYIWRGVSQTNNGPAMQGEFKIKSSVGLYVSTWGSNVKFTDSNDDIATTELNYSVGFEKEIGNAEVNLGAWFYGYPQAKRVDYTEPFVWLGYKFIHVSVAYSSNVFGSGNSGTYYSGGLDYTLKSQYPVLKGVSVGAGTGYYAFSGGVYGEKSYWNYQLYVKKSFKHFAVEIAWTDTNGGFDAGRLDGSCVVAKLFAYI